MHENVLSWGGGGGGGGGNSIVKGLNQIGRTSTLVL